MSGFPVFPRDLTGLNATLEQFSGIWRTHKLGDDVDEHGSSVEVYQAWGWARVTMAGAGSNSLKAPVSKFDSEMGL